MDAGLKYIIVNQHYKYKGEQMVKLFSWQQNNHIPRSATFVLTELGRAKAENFTGDDRTRICMTLDQNGASNLEEISRISKINKGKIERMIPTLVKGGFIQSVRGEVNND